ncbi:YidC/Oxa1 family membrane protein insertase [uncultured Brachyspira sp.]|uniref:YidC/Oxa1 family membrane protein insertase n=1 Tax=uncultured Brachyspira sp. TaxID=221953 RepID=UPI0026296648|nr:YidC/Oxa1 family membrane protein insertase [uncultured Brachyspira sp.]
MFFDILYNITIYPIEFIIETLFYLFKTVFQSSYGMSLFFLSLCINFISLPLYNIAESWQDKERAIQDKMKPMIDNIKAVYKGDQRYLLIRACQRINGYKTIYAFRGTLGLLIQIPFFIAAYNFVYSLSGLNEVSFLFINDLSKPDSLIHIGDFSINLLPFLMTLFSLLAGLVYAKKLTFKESLPLYTVSLIFLVLLYNSPSALLFYWTINCLFSLVKNIFIEYRLYNIFVVNRYKLLKFYNIFFIVITVLFILLISLAGIERKAYLSDFNFIFIKNNNYLYSAKVKYYSKIFKSSDIFEFNGNINKLTKHVKKIEFNGFNTKYAIAELDNDIDSIDGNIDIYYNLKPKSYSINIYIFLLILAFIINLGNIYQFIFKDSYINNFFINHRNKLLVLSCLIISLLSGLFIPTSLISTSPQEFTDPFFLILNTLSISLGLFLFYPIFIYLLFSEKIKNYLALLLMFLVFIVLINTFIMVGNYLNINSDFIFDNSSLLISSFKDILLMIILIVLSSMLVIFILRNKKSIILINIYYIILIVFISISIFKVYAIIKSHSHIVKYDNSYNKNDIKIFNLSKTGDNIFVFILDRAINSYWMDALERFTEYKEKLDGFIIYPNTASFSSHTTTIASIYGGYCYMPYELSTNGNYSIKDKHNEALLMLPLSLEKYGYKSSILEPAYANFNDVPDLSIFDGYSNINAYNNNRIDNYSISKYLNITNFNINNKKKINQKNRMIRFSIFRMLPINLRYDFYKNGTWFNFDIFNVNSSVYTYAILSNTKDFINIKEEGNYYNILHNMITHEPQFFASDYLPYSESKNIKDEDLLIYKNALSVKHFYANIASINILIDFIEYLKDNNIYDNTKIILISDHGENVNTTVFTNDSSKFISLFNSLLIYKDFNSKGNIQIDTNFMTIADLPYMAVKHIPNIKNIFNDKIITNDYKTNGVYIVNLNKWEIHKQFYNYYNFDNYYYVKDNIFDINNWKRFNMDWNTKESKEIELK